ncbi:MAG: hypothetical protein QM817_38455 [Archangium sp.]
MKRSVFLGFGAVLLGAALVALYFVSSDPDEVHAYVSEKDVPKPQLAKVCPMQLWEVRGAKGAQLWVGHLSDAACSEKLPALCFKRGDTHKPEDFTLPAQATWTGGELGLLQDLRAGDDALPGEDPCTAKYGSDWRMARVDDGGAFGLAATGEFAPTARFWVRR